MDEVRRALLTSLQSLFGEFCEQSLATNSLKIRFDCRATEKGRVYIWIDPPLRMTLDGKLVTGSADWPVWDGVEDEGTNRPIWEAWCELFDPLYQTTLVGASVGELFPDLRLVFKSGHQIETFGNSGNGYWWYYRDRITGEVFEAGAAGINHEYAEPAGP